MKVQAITQYEQSDVEMEGASDVKMRMLIGPGDGAENFHMRHFEVAPGGHTPLHQHGFEHEVLILSGIGIVRSERGKRDLYPGDVIFVPPDEEHQFVNNGNQPLTFICVIPAPRGDKS